MEPAPVRTGLMAPPSAPRVARGLMAPRSRADTGAPMLFAPRPGAFDEFRLHVELRRLAWAAVLVLATVLYLTQ